jgi:hypothetical protein
MPKDSVECPDMGDLFSDDELSFASLPTEPNSVPDLMELLRTPTQVLFKCLLCRLDLFVFVHRKPVSCHIPSLHPSMQISL